MTHEPECPTPQQLVSAETCDHCRYLRRAYQRGFTDGYNQHARSVQHWQDTHGAYRQHGEGTNP